MKTLCLSICTGVAAICLLMLPGCGKQADEKKPLSEVQAEAEKMNTDDLRAMAVKYKDAIVAKTTEVGKLKDKIKQTPVTEALGGEASKLKQEADALGKSLNALEERFEIYYNKLKEKKGDLSGLGL